MGKTGSGTARRMTPAAHALVPAACIRALRHVTPVRQRTVMASIDPPTSASHHERVASGRPPRNPCNCTCIRDLRDRQPAPTAMCGPRGWNRTTGLPRIRRELCTTELREVNWPGRIRTGDRDLRRIACFR